METGKKWYEKIGLEDNPFVLDPFKQEIIIDLEIKKEIIYRINSGSIMFIEGKKGFGKTSFLVEIINNFKGERRVIYIDCKNLDLNINIKKILLERQNFFEKLTKKLPQDMVLLIDNVHVLNRKNCERIKYYFDHNYIKSVVLTGESLEKSGFSEGLKHRIGNRVLKIDKLDAEKAQQILNRRTNYRSVIPDETLGSIVKLSKNNPHNLLLNCEALCQYLVEENIYDDFSKLTAKQVVKELEKAQERYLGAENGRTLV